MVGPPVNVSHLNKARGALEEDQAQSSASIYNLVFWAPVGPLNLTLITGGPDPGGDGDHFLFLSIFISDTFGSVFHRRRSVTPTLAGRAEDLTKLVICLVPNVRWVC